VFHVDLLISTPRYMNQRIQFLSTSPTEICAHGFSFVFVLYFHSFPFVFPIFPLGIGLITKLSVQVCGVRGLAHQNVQNDQTEYMITITTITCIWENIKNNIYICIYIYVYIYICIYIYIYTLILNPK